MIKENLNFIIVVALVAVALGSIAIVISQYTNYSMELANPAMQDMFMYFQ